MGNQASTLSIMELITLDAAIGAEFISPTPMLVVHGERDDYCSPDGARAVYEGGGGAEEARLAARAAAHRLLRQRRFRRGPAVEEVVAWFDAHLARPAAPA